MLTFFYLNICFINFKKLNIYFIRIYFITKTLDSKKKNDNSYIW
jgi:hypothetical protein